MLREGPLTFTPKAFTYQNILDIWFSRLEIVGGQISCPQCPIHAHSTAGAQYTCCRNETLFCTFLWSGEICYSRICIPGYSEKQGRLWQQSGAAKAPKVERDEPLVSSGSHLGPWSSHQPSKTSQDWREWQRLSDTSHHFWVWDCLKAWCSCGILFVLLSRRQFLFVKPDK